MYSRPNTMLGDGEAYHTAAVRRFGGTGAPVVAEILAHVFWMRAEAKVGWYGLTGVASDSGTMRVDPAGRAP